MIPMKHFTIVDRISLSSLADYEFHRRLGVFLRSGTTCVCCGIKGTKLLKLRDNRNGEIHTDIYTDDMTLMTVDHIYPRGLGGTDAFTNKQPMCSPCNAIKGKAFISLDTLKQIVAEHNENVSRAMEEKLARLRAR